MRVAAVVAVLGLTMASSSGHVMSIHGYGMSMTLPAGWRGSIGHGYLIARGDGLTLRIDEWQDKRQDREGFFYFRMHAPVHMRVRNFGPGAAAPRFRLQAAISSSSRTGGLRRARCGI